MALADDIRTLRDRTLADLIAAHDYYADTKTAWDFLVRFVTAGTTFHTRNEITGTVSTQVDLAGKAQRYIAEQLTEATFQQFLSIFENFFFDLLRLWLTAHPKSLLGKQVDFRTVLEAPDKDAITELVVDRELNDIAYKRPAGWFAYLEERTKLGLPATEDIERFAESKATRDALVHNRGVAGKSYESKAGRYSRHTDGERIDIPDDYHRATWNLFCRLVPEICDAAIAKAA